MKTSPRSTSALLPSVARNTPGLLSQVSERNFSTGSGATSAARASLSTADQNGEEEAKGGAPGGEAAAAAPAVGGGGSFASSTFPWESRRSRAASSFIFAARRLPLAALSDGSDGGTAAAVSVALGARPRLVVVIKLEASETFFSCSFYPLVKK